MPYTPSSLDLILNAAAEARASDVHLTEGAPALMRVDGDLVGVPGHPQVLSQAWLEAAARSVMSPAQQSLFEAENEVDLAYAVPETGRFRVNIFRQLGKLAGAFRLIPTVVKTLDDLGLPQVVRDLALKPRGLVLVTGPTGSGKSTTLAAMVDIVNRTLPVHIITIEDPIEYLHTSRRALIHQREIGADTASFSEALRRILRQDPDVILVGELRDQESIAVALTAAETGHLVLGTLHTQGAAKSIDRIIDTFPARQQDQIRSQLGDTLQGVVSQTLLPLAQRAGRAPATEILVHTPAVGNLIREGQVEQLYSVMQAGVALGMHTLDMSLRELVASGKVAKHIAQQYAVDPHTLDGVRVEIDDLDAQEWGSYPAPRGGGVLA
ncbi:MAG: type IV pilus twitching motility protein PilT [Propionicimonas sp.]|nr:type IV pilus twitching motility protein PilT [Propionicimonas sp.]